ncbi:hypothetical protein AGLY_002931 [Aphis glycines]|uniref:Uncharacterized protein n=1 Tax=Aphis glycines TaxID=307491 RepID=A0A6G0U2K9_APHGL|nr:hypothetical protein AGLY_002931 [Aphis glycines]
MYSPISLDWAIRLNNKYRSLEVFNAVQQDEIPVPKIFILNHALYLSNILSTNSSSSIKLKPVSMGSSKSSSIFIRFLLLLLLVNNFRLGGSQDRSTEASSLELVSSISALLASSLAFLFSSLCFALTFSRNSCLSYTSSSRNICLACSISIPPLSLLFSYSRAICETFVLALSIDNSTSSSKSSVSGIMIYIDDLNLYQQKNLYLKLKRQIHFYLSLKIQILYKKQKHAELILLKCDLLLK